MRLNLLLSDPGGSTQICFKEPHREVKAECKLRERKDWAQAFIRVCGGVLWGSWDKANWSVQTRRSGLV